jgi:branched-chain amino acid transport system substrate-binding protein
LHRDDALGVVAAQYIADHWPDKKIATLHDNTTFGKDSADLTKEQLNRRGLTEAIYKAYVPGKRDYVAEIDELQTADIGVVFVGDTLPRWRSWHVRQGTAATRFSW